MAIEWYPQQIWLFPSISRGQYPDYGLLGQSNSLLLLELYLAGRSSNWAHEKLTCRHMLDRDDRDRKRKKKMENQVTRFNNI